MRALRTSAIGACLLVAGISLDAWAEGPVVVLVRTILATDAGDHFDERLVAQRRQLEGLFRYSSYRLVKEEERSCAFGNPHSFEIPGGRFLQIVAKKVRGRRVHLHVTLIEGSEAPPLDTDFSLPNKGNLWVAGPRHPDGVLLISIGAETR